MKKPTENREEIAPDRLIEVTEAVLTGIEETQKTHGKLIYPPALVGTAMQPKATRECSKHEIEEATAFLVRLGVIAPVAD